MNKLSGLTTGLVLAYAGMTMAQTSEPIQPVSLTDIGGELFFRSHYRTEDEDRAGGGTTRERDLLFEEGIDLRTQGYFYHPNLIDWDADLRLGFEQQKTDIDRDRQRSNGTLLGYDLSALLLKQKKVSGRVFASQSQDFISRDFARNTELDSMRQGAEMLVRGDYPMSFSFEHLNIQETSDVRDDDQETFLGRFNIQTQKNPDFFTDLTYEHESTSETSTFFSPTGGPGIPNDLPTERDEVNISNLWRFGDGPRKHRLSGRFRAMSRRGFFKNDIVSFNQLLELNHSDTLTSFYRLGVDLDKTETQNDRFLDGEVGVTKRFYDSLEITARALASDRRFDNGSETSFGGLFNARYRKKTPVGLFTSNLSLGRRWQSQDSSGGQRLIRDESATLSDFNFVKLDQPNPVPGSIVVTDDRNTVQFVEGVDYLLRRTGSRVEIARLIGGSIPDGSNVLVDYQTLIARNADFTTDTLNWNNRLQLKPLPVALYTRTRYFNEQLQSGEDPGNLDKRLVSLFGAELDYRGLTLTGEYEMRNEELFPDSTTSRFRARYRRNIAGQTDFSAGAQYEFISFTNTESFGFEPDENTLKTMGAFANVTSRIHRTTLIRLGTDYLETSGRENDMLLRFTAGLEW